MLATNVGELATHVHDGETGWLVPPGDVEALTDSITAALSDRELAETLGCQALAYGLGAFDWNVIGRNLAEVLRQRGTGPVSRPDGASQPPT